MRVLSILMGLCFLPALGLSHDGKQYQQKPQVPPKEEVQQKPQLPPQLPPKEEVQQQEAELPPRTLIIKVKMTPQGEEEAQAEALACDFANPVTNLQTAQAANKTCEKVAPVQLTETSAQGKPEKEIQMLFDLQDMIAADPIKTDSEVTDAPRWRFHGGRGFYGFGHRGNWGYGRHFHRHASYGYWYNRLLYPYVNYGYTYPYGGYNYYYYYNPYYY